MQRSLFDSADRPRRQKEEDAAKPAEPRIYSVSELNTEVKLLMESTYRNVWVEGEISNFSQPSSGHFYFCLKDADSQIKAVMWKSNQRFLKWRPRNGMKVMISGKLAVYEPRGEYQIDIQQIVPHGKGDLAEAYEQLKEKLKAEGLFDQKRKRPIPMLPKKIGIVTSRSGAAIRDMLQILNRRYGTVSVLLYPAIVQGEEAAPSIVEGIRVLNRYRDIDVLIVGRGGGSLEDLWPFNEERVARAIVASRIPVISAVGHETDTTIADWVADLRAPTPSAAAEMVIGIKSELLDKVQQLNKRAQAHIRHLLVRCLHTARSLSEHRALTGVPQKIRTHQQTVDDCDLRLRAGLERFHQQSVKRHLLAGQKLSPAQLRHLIEVKRSRLNEFTVSLKNAVTRMYRDQNKRREAAEQKLGAAPLRRVIDVQRNRMSGVDARLFRAFVAQASRGREELARAAGKLDSLSPLAVLERGYSIAAAENGSILKESSQATPGENIKVKLHRGALKCQVTEVENE